jgi:hypothetical protein
LSVAEGRPWAQITNRYRVIVIGAAALVGAGAEAGTVGIGEVVIREAGGCDPRLGAVEVLKPNCRITASRSAFCTGFAKYAVNRLFCSEGSEPPYALTAMIGVVAFLLFVVLIYRAAPSPSTMQLTSAKSLRSDLYY